MGDVVLTARQRVIIKGIILEAKTRYGENKYGYQAACIATITSFPESGCRMLANANVPESIKYEHDLLPWTYDGLGHDHASCGDFQQQTGYRWVPAGYGWAMNQTTMNSPDGWGTPKQLMNPVITAAKFFNAMESKHPNKSWYNRPAWVVAQNVQGSAYDGNPRAANNYNSTYGGNYLGMRLHGRLAVRLLWNTVKIGKPIKPVKPKPPKVVKPTKPSPKPKPVKSTAPKVVTVRYGQTLAGIAANNRTTWPKLVQLNAKAHPSLTNRPDFIQPGWKIRVR